MQARTSALTIPAGQSYTTVVAMSVSVETWTRFQIASFAGIALMPENIQ